MLNAPITTLWGVGSVLVKKLKDLKIETCRDLIFYYPRRFDDFSAIEPIKDLRAGMTTTISGTVELITNHRSRSRRMIVTEALITDDSGSIKCIWFNQPFLLKNIPVGSRVNISGKTSDNFFDLAFVGPAYEKIFSNHEGVHTGRLVPVYPLTAGVTQKQFRVFVKAALDAFVAEIQEWLPEEVLDREHLHSLGDALRAIHFPTTSEEWSLARRRLAFDELLALQITQKVARKNLEEMPATSIVFREEESRRFLASLPFTLTESQKKAGWDILRDMAKATPMNRLLEGDVGSGKTVVSALAALNAALAGTQVVYLAPTEILAQQIFERFREWLHLFDVSCVLITGKMSIVGQEKLSKAGALQYIASGQARVIVGTHALLQERVIFSNIGLAIVDEQHRFGVEQRRTLREKNSVGCMPHLLSMTATPIPRSLALTIYGDLDLSLIDTLPTGRKKIITKVVPARYRQWTYDFIKQEIAKGRQVFILCPRIDETDDTGVKSVTAEFARLSKDIFPDERVGMLHGKLPSIKKSRVMQDMLEKKIDILVSTSVIEVGIDIPNATIMLIEGAERFGLAQLHQFRGRVGRGAYQSYCFLMPTTQEKEDIARLRALVKSNDGFALAEEDLRDRGQGDVVGSRQSGLPTLKIASLSDRDLIASSRKWAEVFVGDKKYREVVDRATKREVHLE